MAAGDRPCKYGVAVRICKAEAETENQGVKLVLNIDPAPDSIRCRIFLLCFASFVETLCDRIWA